MKSIFYHKLKNVFTICLFKCLKLISIVTNYVIVALSHLQILVYTITLHKLNNYNMNFLKLVWVFVGEGVTPRVGFRENGNQNRVMERGLGWFGCGVFDLVTRIDPGMGGLGRGSQVWDKQIREKKKRQMDKTSHSSLQAKHHRNMKSKDFETNQSACFRVQSQ